MRAAVLSIARDVKEHRYDYFCKHDITTHVAVLITAFSGGKGCAGVLAESAAEENTTVGKLPSAAAMRNVKVTVDGNRAVMNPESKEPTNLLYVEGHWEFDNLGGTGTQQGATTGPTATGPTSTSTATAPSVTIPPNARVLVRKASRGESPALPFTTTLKAPLPPLYVQVNSDPPAHVTVNGNVSCSNADYSQSIRADIPVSEGEGEIVVSVRPPRGLQSGMECSFGIGTAARGLMWVQRPS